jgi:aminotransferase EvaB
MQVRVWSYLNEYINEKDEVHEAIEQVLNSEVLILGENVKQFENEFSAYCQSKFGIGVNSATDAIFFALKALGVDPGDEIITVSNTAVPTVSAIAAIGAIPKFVDIDPASYLMKVEQIVDIITPKTKGIIAVHLFGQCVEMDLLTEIATKYNLFIIEDCAQSHGAQYKGRIAGSMSQVSTFSFYPTKILGGYGDGGMMVTADNELTNKMKRLRFYGMEKTYYAIEHGYNSRLDELHAAILRKKLLHIDEYINNRRRIAKRYDEELKHTSLQLPVELPENKHAYYVYVVRHPDRNKIMEKLKEKNILLNISYPWPIHTMTGYEYLGYKVGDLPETEKAAKEIFSLPMYPSLSYDEQSYVINTLHSILDSY